MKNNKEEVTAVSSLDVAETFQKEHKRVIEDIRRIEDTINRA
ncbi:Rha family transcriptional regulator [Lachnotalea glycerini]